MQRFARRRGLSRAQVETEIGEETGGINRVGGLRAFHTALAKRAASPVDILCLGTSLTEGTKASTLETRWVALLRDKLRARFPVAGVTGGQGYIASEFKSPPLSGQPFAFTGGASGTVGSALFGLGRKYRTLSTTGDKVAITVRCTSFDVLYTRGTSQGTMGVKIDAGAVTNVSNAGATQSGTAWSSGALTPGDHAIEVSWVSGGTVLVEGIMVYDGDETKGIRVWEGGYGGAKSEFLSGAASYWFKAFATVAPDLVVIELGANDWWYYTGDSGGGFGVYPPSVVRANIEVLIAGIRANTATDPSILLIAVHDRGDEWPAGSEVPWSEYVEMYRQMARDDADVAMIDIPTRIGPTPFSGSGLIDADNVHLTDAGNEFYASAIAGFLEP